MSEKNSYAPESDSGSESKRISFELANISNKLSFWDGYRDVNTGWNVRDHFFLKAFSTFS